MGAARRPGHPGLGININARILLVAGHPANQFLMTRILSRQGFWLVDTARNGGEALARFRAGLYDMVLMDGDIEKMNGFEAALHMRGHEAGVRHTPIVAITADAVTGDREKCLKAGMDDYLGKPLDATRFKKMLAQYVPGDTPLDMDLNHKPDERELFTLLSDHGNAALAALDDIDPKDVPDDEIH